MKPRLAVSKKWTELPPEFVKKARQVFVDEFQPEAKRGEFILEGRIYPTEVLVRLGYIESGRLKQVNFEASMDLAPLPAPAPATEASAGQAAPSSMDRLFTCIDALGSVIEEYFDRDPVDGEENGDDVIMDIPDMWQSYDFEGEKVYLQHSTVNTTLEAEADRLLGISQKALVHENEESEDALAQAEIDSELALGVQQAIRDGRYQVPYTEGTDEDSSI
jgi:hypothetical protein